MDDMDRDNVDQEDAVVLYDVAALEASRRRHPANRGRDDAAYVAEGLVIGGAPVFN